MQQSPSFVEREVLTRIRYGEDLAGRAALYAARSKFVEALRIIALSLDAGHPDEKHSRALDAGLKALDEADDFAQAGQAPTTDLSVLIAKHQTPVLHGAKLDEISRVKAGQRYLGYGRDKLIAACGEEPVASIALSHLGRAWAAQTSKTADASIGMAKAVVLHQAALTVNPQDSIAANELGVLLARCGRLDQAAAYLEQSISIQETPENWSNLSRVLKLSGDLHGAQRAHGRYMLLVGKQAHSESKANTSENPPDVTWVQPAEFVEIGSGEVDTFLTSAELTEQSAPAVDASSKRGTRPTILSKTLRGLGSRRK